MPRLALRNAPVLDQSYGINRSSPQAAGLKYALAADTLLDLTGSTPIGTITGTKIGVLPGIGEMRGFGTTNGVGTTDVVTTGVINQSALITRTAWIYITGAGGGGLARIWDKAASGLPADNVYYDSGANILVISQGWTGDGEWTVAAPSVGVLHHFALVFDMSAAGNNPIVYIDGISVTVTRTFLPTGTLVTSTNAYILGNASAGTRNWNGYIADFRVYDTLLSPQIIWQMYAPQTRYDLFLPAQWQTNTWRPRTDLITPAIVTNTPTVTFSRRIASVTLVTRASVITALRVVKYPITLTRASTASFIRRVNRTTLVSQASTVTQTFSRFLVRTATVTQASTITCTKIAAYAITVLVTRATSVSATRLIKRIISLTSTPTINAVGPMANFRILVGLGNLVTFTYKVLRKFVVDYRGINVVNSNRIDPPDPDPTSPSGAEYRREDHRHG